MRLELPRSLTPVSILTHPRDSLRMAACILVDDRYYLYCDYTSADSPYAPHTFDSELHLFVSDDLQTWQHRGPVVTPSPEEDAPDSFGSVNIDVLASGEKYYLYYTGISGPKDQGSREEYLHKAPPGWTESPNGPHYLASCIMVAEADRPQGPFRKHEPILHLGPDGAWDRWKILDPHVAELNGRYLLYYKGFNGRGFETRNIGLAVSDSPIGPFRKHRNNPIITGVEHGGVEVPAVVRAGGRLAMILMTFPPDREWLFLESDDGIRWHNHGNIAEIHALAGLDVSFVKDEASEPTGFLIQTTPGSGREAIREEAARGTHIRLYKGIIAAS